MCLHSSDKSVRHKSRQKYQEFLEEQAKRNERNKKLVHMLERIDEQTAAMSQRSERLKMMKVSPLASRGKCKDNHTWEIRKMYQKENPRYQTNRIILYIR